MCYKKHSYHSYIFFELASFFFLQFRCQQIGSLHLTRKKSGHVPSPEPNLDMYAVWATIQLMLGQEYGRANLLLLSTQIRRLLASESTSESRSEYSGIGVFVLNQEQLKNCFFPTKTGGAFVHLDEGVTILNRALSPELVYFDNINVLKWVAIEGELQKQNQKPAVRRRLKKRLF